MATKPMLRLPIMDACWRVAKVEAADRAQVPYERVPWPGRPLCFVKVDDLWVTREDGPWVIAYRLVLQDGRLVIGELRVYPRDEHERTGGDVAPPWDVVRDLQGVHAPAPAGGLTATVVHRITPGSDVNVGRLIMENYRGSSARDAKAGIWKHLVSLGIQTPAPPVPATTHRRGGPAGKGLAFYRKAVRVYLEAPAHPVQAVAKALGISPSCASATIYRARHRYGMLQSTVPGRAGGGEMAALQRIATGGKTGRRKTP
jgi:hypothetical protein